MNINIKHVFPPSRIKYKRAIEYIYGTITGKLFGKRIYYVTNKDYYKYAEIYTKQMQAYDLIAGIPRSGLPFAMIISNASKIPFCLSTNLEIWYRGGSPEKILNAIKFGYDDSYIESLVTSECERVPSSPVKSILIVDDSVDRGRTLKNTILNMEAKVTTAVIIGWDYPVDYYSIKLPVNHIFEWGLTNYRFNVLSDIDGVLCENYDTKYDYAQWIKTVKSKLMPKSPIHLFTARKEEFREQTEKWLQENNIRYHNLFMNCTPDIKVQIARRIKPDFIWESDDYLAKKLWWSTRIPIICFDKNTIICR